MLEEYESVAKPLGHARHVRGNVDRVAIRRGPSYTCAIECASRTILLAATTRCDGAKVA